MANAKEEWNGCLLQRSVMKRAVDMSTSVDMSTGVGARSHAPAPQETLGFPPTLQAIGKPVLEHERWSFTFHLIMETDAVVIGIWHSRDLPLNTLAWHHALLTPEAQNLEPHETEISHGRALRQTR